MSVWIVKSLGRRGSGTLAGPKNATYTANSPIVLESLVQVTHLHGELLLNRFSTWSTQRHLSFQVVGIEPLQ